MRRQSIRDLATPSSQQGAASVTGQMAKQRHQREILCAIQRARPRVPPHATSIQTIPELEGMSVKNNLPGADAPAARLLNAVKSGLIMIGLIGK